MARLSKHVAASRKAGAAAGKSIKTTNATHGANRGAGLPPALQKHLHKHAFAPLRPVNRRIARAVAAMARRLIAGLGGHQRGNQVEATRSQAAFIVVDGEYYQSLKVNKRAGLINADALESRDRKTFNAFKLEIAKAAGWTATERVLLKRVIVELKLQLAGAKAGRQHVDAGGAPRSALLVALQDGTPATLFATAASLARARAHAPWATTWYDLACAAKTLGTLEEAASSPSMNMGDSNYVMVDYPHRSPAAGAQDRLIAYCAWHSDDRRLTGNLGDPKFVKTIRLGSARREAS